MLWAIGFGAVYFALQRDRAAAIVVGLVVLSHWVLDFIVHRPDLPLIPDRFKVGLGLWNFVLGTIALELAMFIAGLVLYLRVTRAKDRIGKLGVLGADRVPARPLCLGDPRPAAAQRADARLDGVADLADAALGLVGGPPPRGARLKRPRPWLAKGRHVLYRSDLRAARP